METEPLRRNHPSKVSSGQNDPYFAGPGPTRIVGSGGSGSVEAPPPRTSRRSISAEIGGVLYRRPAVLEAAVVARPRRGRDPVRLRHAEGGQGGDGERDHRLLQGQHGELQGALTAVSGALAKTSTGKIQKYVLCDEARAL